MVAPTPTATATGTNVWVARGLWAVIGAGLYATITGMMCQSTPVPATSVEPDLAPVEAAGPEVSRSRDTRSVAAASAVSQDDSDASPATNAAPRSGVPADPIPSAPAASISPPAAPKDVPEPEVVPVPAVKPGPAPEFPLPRMPGSNKLGGGQKFDAEKGAWVITRAYEIPASRELVTKFYRKALADLDLEISQGEGPPAEDGSIRAFVKGRKDGASGHVTARQVPGHLDTRVRVIWREWR